MVAACRELFGNPTAAAGPWPLQHAVLGSVVWVVGLTALAAPLAAWRFSRLSR